MGTGPVSAVSPLIAHVVGKHSGAGAMARKSGSRAAANRFSVRTRDQHEVRAVARMGLWSVALISPPLLAVLFFTRPILLLLHQEPQLAADAGRYTAALAMGLPCSLAFQVLRNFSTSLSKPLPPMVVMGLAILFNAVGDYTFIFGHFGLPQLGLVGAGISSASSNFFTLVVMTLIALSIPALRRYRHPAPAFAPALALAGRTVSPGRAHRHHHAVRGGAVQRRHFGHGHLRHRDLGRAPDRHHHPLPDLHDPAGHRAGGHGAGGAGGGRGRPISRRGAPASPPWPWARLFMCAWR